MSIVGHQILPMRLRRFGTCRRGATAVEFGLVALPFFGLMFAIIETALMFWSTQVLETAVANASRKLYTGQFQTDSKNSGLTDEQLRVKFKDMVCSDVTGLFDCKTLVDIDVRPIDNYAAASTAPPIDKNKKYDPSGYGYKKPSANQITLVRASLQYPAYTTLLGSNTGLANGKRLIMAAATFRTEPYQ